jgi:hypothetical protein
LCSSGQQKDATAHLPAGWQRECAQFLTDLALLSMRGPHSRPSNSAKLDGGFNVSLASEDPFRTQNNAVNQHPIAHLLFVKLCKAGLLEDALPLHGFALLNQETAFRLCFWIQRCRGSHCLRRWLLGGFGRHIDCVARRELK